MEKGSSIWLPRSSMPRRKKARMAVTGTRSLPEEEQTPEIGISNRIAVRT